MTGDPARGRAPTGDQQPLRDSTRALVRPIEPDDRDALRAGFDRLSQGSRYRRFLTSMTRLSSSQLSYLTEVDHHDHEALIAFDPGTGDAVGVARYIRERGSDRAEAAVTVADDWQGRGLGTALTRRLARRALEEGVRVFTALLLSTNTDMLDLLRAVGDVHIGDREPDQGAIEVEVPLEPDGEGGGPRLHRVLRAVASTPTEFAPGGGRGSPPSQPGG